jgi:hypothetical protein
LWRSIDDAKMALQRDHDRMELPCLSWEIHIDEIRRTTDGDAIGAADKPDWPEA